MFWHSAESLDVAWCDVVFTAYSVASVERGFFRSVGVLGVSDWNGVRKVLPGKFQIRVGMQTQWLRHEMQLTGEAMTTEDYSHAFI